MGVFGSTNTRLKEVAIDNVHAHNSNENNAENDLHRDIGGVFDLGVNAAQNAHRVLNLAALGDRHVLAHQLLRKMLKVVQSLQQIHQLQLVGLTVRPQHLEVDVHKRPNVVAELMSRNNCWY